MGGFGSTSTTFNLLGSNPLTKDNGNDLESLLKAQQHNELAIQLAVKNAYGSNDIEQILKANKYTSQLYNKQLEERKSLILDPQDLFISNGYRNKPYSLDYGTLRRMGRTHLIKSIVETRKEQVSLFCEPQVDQKKPGFIIRKKRTFFDKLNKKDAKLSKEEEREIEELIEFVLNCGSNKNKWIGDDFDGFARKVIEDSLILDQGTFEIVRNRKGEICEYMAVDGATFALADSYDNQVIEDDDVFIDGIAPTYVQVVNSIVQSEFYPWELCFGVRNPSTNLLTHGYGKSELEDMVQTVTALLNADYYNANFFKVGSSPKGILKYSGNINENTIEDFRQRWIAQVSGVENHHKIPLINADKLDFINTHIPNKDMEFTNYQEFLIKIACAMYKIDPSEVGFAFAGSADARPLFEGNNETKLKYSRDKGLYPLLRKFQKWMQKYIIDPINPKYEFVFIGLDERDEDKEQEFDIKAGQNYMTINEIRAKRNMPPIPEGDIILNPAFIQNKSVEMMSLLQGGEGEEEEEENPFTKGLAEDLGEILTRRPD